MWMRCFSRRQKAGVRNQETEWLWRRRVEALDVCSVDKDSAVVAKIGVENRQGAQNRLESRPLHGPHAQTDYKEDSGDGMDSSNSKSSSRIDPNFEVVIAFEQPRLAAEA
jgi:hypothetical protein